MSDSHIPALRALWRDLAEKRIEDGVDYPRIVLELFKDIDKLKADLAFAMHQGGVDVAAAYATGLADGKRNAAAERGEDRYDGLS